MNRDRLWFVAACVSFALAVAGFIAFQIATPEHPADMEDGLLIMAAGVFGAAAWQWRLVLQNPSDRSRRDTARLLLLGYWATIVFLGLAAAFESRFGYVGE